MRIMLLSQKICLFLWICCFTVSCASFTKKDQAPPLSEEQISQMNQALLFLQNKGFLKGAKIYDQLAISVRAESAKSLMLFNAGVAYKEAGYCEKALIRGRALLDRSLKDPSFKARSLMEISYIYECLGNTELAFLSLKDADKFRSSLPWALNQIIYPARLAIAYAWLGKISQAERYKSLALTKVLQSKKAFSSEKELRQRVSRMFYLMGRSYMAKKNLQPEAFFQAFSYHQLFLLQSLFLKDETWSSLSKKELDLLFDKLFAAIAGDKQKKHKKLLVQALRDAQALIQREKSKEWEIFYSKKSKTALKLLSKPLKK